MLSVRRPGARSGVFSEDKQKLTNQTLNKFLGNKEPRRKQRGIRPKKIKPKRLTIRLIEAFLFFVPIYLMPLACIAESSGLMQLTKDRPRLLEIIQKGDTVWCWLDKRFQDTNGLPVIWSTEKPKGPDHYLSAHTYNDAGQTILMVEDKNPNGTLVPSEKMLALIVFELLNATHRDQFYEQCHLAQNGALSKAAFIRAMAQIEHDSIMQLQRFQIDIWYPYAAERHISWKNDYWMKGACQDFDQWYRIQKLIINGYPDDIYGPYYDSLVLLSQPKVNNNKYLRESSNEYISDQSDILNLNNSRAYFNRGNAKKADGDLSGAAAAYNKAIELNPSYAHAYCNRGNLKKDEGDVSGAMLDYNKAIQCDPMKPQYYENRANLKLYANDMKGAIVDYTVAIRLDAKDSNAYAARAYALSKEKDIDGAITDYARAIQLNPINAYAYTNKAREEYAKGDLDAALIDYSHAIQLHSGDANSYLWRSVVYEDNGQWGEALADLRKYCELNPEDSDYTYLHIWLLRTRKDGQQSGANQELAAYLSTRSSSIDWVSEIAGFLLGKINELKLFDAAGFSGVNKSTQQLCEMWYYAGMKRLFTGDKLIAEDYFKQCIATRKSDEIEYILAETELRRMKKDR